MKLEICVDNLESALIAAKCGADRLEVCEDLSVGGLTPSIEFINDVKQICGIPVFVIIRPRPGNFSYNKTEKDQIIKDADIRKNIVDGFVFGALDEDCNIDVAFCKRFLAAACGLPVTFHRAFDEIPDKEKALEDLICLGFQRLLTTGGPKTAEEGIKKLRELIFQASSRITIMPGGGVTDENISYILKNTEATEFHSSGRTTDHSTVTSKSKVCSVKAVQNMSNILKLAALRKIL